MNTPTAYQGEMMLAGWNETHSGGAKVTFWLPDAEALDPFRHMTAKKGRTAGQRFMAVLVMLGDDDTPVNPRDAAEASQRGKPLAKSAALICKSADFQRFVAAVEGVELTTQEGKELQAADHIRSQCGVTSRGDIDGDAKAKRRFQALMERYREWMQHNVEGR